MIEALELYLLFVLAVFVIGAKRLYKLVSQYIELDENLFKWCELFDSLRARVLVPLCVHGALSLGLALFRPVLAEYYPFLDLPRILVELCNLDVMTVSWIEPFLATFYTYFLFTAPFFWSIIAVLLYTWIRDDPEWTKEEDRLARRVLAGALILMWLGLAYSWTIVGVATDIITYFTPSNVETKISYLEYIKAWLLFYVSAVLGLAGTIAYKHWLKQTGKKETYPVYAVIAYLVTAWLTPGDLLSSLPLILPVLLAPLAYTRRNTALALAVTLLVTLSAYNMLGIISAAILLATTLTLILL